MQTKSSSSLVEILNIYMSNCCLLYTSDAADERSSVDLGGRRIIKKKKTTNFYTYRDMYYKMIQSVAHTYYIQNETYIER